MEQTSSGQRAGIVGLVQGLFMDLKRLAAQQLRLAVDEMHDELGRMVRIGVSIAGLMVFALTLAVLLALTAVAALHELAGLSLWASSLLVATVFMVCIAGLALFVKQQIARFRPYPVRTLFTLKEDAIWIREQIVSRKT